MIVFGTSNDAKAALWDRALRWLWRRSRRLARNNAGVRSALWIGGLPRRRAPATSVRAAGRDRRADPEAALTGDRRRRSWRRGSRGLVGVIRRLRAADGERERPRVARGDLHATRHDHRDMERECNRDAAPRQGGVLIAKIIGRSSLTSSGLRRSSFVANCDGLRGAGWRRGAMPREKGGANCAEYRCSPTICVLVALCRRTCARSDWDRQEPRRNAQRCLRGLLRDVIVRTLYVLLCDASGGNSRAFWYRAGGRAGRADEAVIRVTLVVDPLPGCILRMGSRPFCHAWFRGQGHDAYKSIGVASVLLTRPWDLTPRCLHIHWSCKQSVYNSIGVVSTLRTTPLGL